MSCSSKRSSSVMNRGLPPVWRYTVSASSWGGVNPKAVSTKDVTSDSLRPRSVVRRKQSSWVSSPKVKFNGCRLVNSASWKVPSNIR